MPVWLVTGGSGFLGGHVLAALGEDRPPGVEVVALGRRSPPGWSPDAFVRADLDDAVGLARVVESVRPGVVIHAAGQTPPSRPERYFQANTRATSHLLGALRGAGRPVRVVLTGSAAELGRVESDGRPVGEETPCRPFEPYGLSKWFAGAAGLACRPPMEVMVARIFNPIGPGMPPNQAFGRFAARLAEPGPDPLTLAVGDLDGRRDFVDARDVARALLALATRGRAGLVYHVGTGRSHRVGEGLERLIHLSGRAVIVAIRPPTGGPSGPRDSRAEIGRIREHTGWTPRIAWEQSLSDLWDEVRSRPRFPLTAASSSV